MEGLRSPKQVRPSFFRRIPIGLSFQIVGSKKPFPFKPAKHTQKKKKQVPEKPPEIAVAQFFPLKTTQKTNNGTLKKRNTCRRATSKQNKTKIHRSTLRRRSPAPRVCARRSWSCSSALLIFFFRACACGLFVGIKTSTAGPGRRGKRKSEESKWVGLVLRAHLFGWSQSESNMK